MGLARHRACGPGLARAYCGQGDLPLSIRPLHLLMFLAVMAIWGFNYVVVKWSVTDFPPLLFVALRFTIVAAMLLPFAAMPRGRWRAMCGLVLTLGVAHFAFMYTGLVLTPASTAALIQQLQVPFAAVLAAIFLGERLSLRRLLGMVVTLIGVTIVIGQPDLTAPWWSQGLILLGSCCWATSAVQLKKMTDLSSNTLNGWMAALAAPLVFLLSFLLEDGHVEAIATITWRAAFGLVYNTMVVVLIAYRFWYFLLDRYDVNQAMPFTLLQPPLAVAFGALFLAEPVGWSLLIGGVIVLAGVALVVLKRPTAPVPEA